MLVRVSLNSIMLPATGAIHVLAKTQTQFQLFKEAIRASHGVSAADRAVRIETTTTLGDGEVPTVLVLVGASEVQGTLQVMQRARARRALIIPVDYA